MKITKIYNTVYAFATQRNATQRNATQRNANQNYILNNNFKFYIFQFFRTLEFLSGFIRFAKTQFANLITMGFNPLHYFATAHNGLKPHCYKKWIATPLVRNDKFKISNDNFNYAFSCALKNKFEIISRNENYAFDYNKYFCRNGNNRIVSSLRGFAKTEVISLVDCFTLFAMTGTIYFLAMIMAESLFLVLGIILISAFYLIEKF